MIHYDHFYVLQTAVHNLPKLLFSSVTLSMKFVILMVVIQSIAKLISWVQFYVFQVRKRMPFFIVIKLN